MGHLSDKYGYYKCTACGAIDTIYSNGDAACCLRCGTPEHYELIEEDQ